METDELYPLEIKKFQNLSWNYISKNAKNKQFVKIHDAFDFLPNSENIPFIPDDATFKAIYFVRHPFDIVPSLSNHSGKNINQTVKFVNQSDACFIDLKKKNSAAANQFNQHLGTWNEHVKSWLVHPTFPVLFLRYEDMKMNTFETFKKAVEFMELSYSDEQIEQALEMTSFDKLRKQEEDKGFKEKSVKTKFYFNKGEINYGKKQLTEEQIESIKTVNEEMMKHFGYWH